LSAVRRHRTRRLPRPMENCHAVPRGRTAWRLPWVVSPSEALPNRAGPVDRHPPPRLNVRRGPRVATE
jgi:hypothetical protein